MKITLMSLRRKWMLWAVPLLGLLLVLPLFVGGYFIFLLQLLGIYIIVATGFNILLGYAGELSLCPAAFMAIGAYTSTLLATKLGIPFGLCTLGGAAAAAAISLILGLPALRLHGVYLAIMTIAFGEIVRLTALRWDSVTGGERGLTVPSLTPGFGGLLASSCLYYVIFVTAILAVICARNMVRSRTGRALIAIRDSGSAAESLGISVVSYRMLAFAVSSFYAGIGGALYAVIMGAITPASFTLSQSLDYLLIIVVGGLGTISGGVYGAVLFSLLQRALSPLQTSQDLIFGVLLFLTVLLMPRGIAGHVAGLSQLRPKFLVKGKT